jgi:hypothetical protein
MRIVPIYQKEANLFVVKFHRHHKQVVGSIFQIGCKVGDSLVGVAICGRPIGRKIDHTKVIEVNRLCVLETVPNACSKLYGAAARIAKEMGYEKIITYTLQSESGVSLKAAGWIQDAVGVGGKSWNSSGTIIRSDKRWDLFGTEQKYPNELKIRWSKMLNKEQEPDRSVANPLNKEQNPD